MFLLVSVGSSEVGSWFVFCVWFLENKGKGIIINVLLNRLYLENKGKFKIYNDVFLNDYMDFVIFCYVL